MANTSNGRRRSASDFMGRARREATLPRILAAGAVAAGAAVYALLRDPDRRERLKQTARDYKERGTAWWNEGTTSRTTAPSASHIPVS